MTMSQAFPGARYRVGCVSDEKASYAAVTWLHPFVSLEPLTAAGLPPRFLRPRQLLAHVWERVEAGGCSWIINHDAEEDEIQGELFKDLDIEAQRLGPLASPFEVYDSPRYGWVAQRS